jgi:colicin import membrane protein
MNIATPAETTQLVTIPKESALSVFTTEKAIDPFLARIREEIDAFVPDVTTPPAARPSPPWPTRWRSPRPIWKASAKPWPTSRRKSRRRSMPAGSSVRDTLDQWRDEVRKPLTDWEAAEEARVKAHTDAITVLNELSRTAPGRDSAGLRESLAQVEAVVIGPACEEFEADYARAKDAAAPP